MTEGGGACYGGTSLARGAREGASLRRTMSRTHSDTTRSGRPRSVGWIIIALAYMLKEGASRTQRPPRKRRGGHARLLSALVAATALLVPGAWAQEKVAAPGGSTSSIPSDIDEAPEYARAAVTLDGVTLFRVRGVTAYPAEQRALTISGRIEALAADRSVPADALRVVEAEDRSNLLAGDHLVMRILDIDATSEGIPRQLLAEVIHQKIVKAVALYRKDRSARVLVVNTAYALGATLIAGLLLVVLRRAFRRLEALAERRFKSRIEAVELRSHQLIQAQQLRAMGYGLMQMLRVVAILAIVYGYLNLVLVLYPWTRPLAKRLFAMVLDPLRTMGTAFLHTCRTWSSSPS
ncbi:MAG: hypothetical protein K8G79_11660 [bacterium]|uniref:Uncharacterized protein n=1 Tax=Candidatus Methylomirabilis tolerans TaxID=3123416 RepID=A0AAJ1EK55_9BACT|nr:hypothetical protein [Candidatus Methylomirabilis sp.]